MEAKFKAALRDMKPSELDTLSVDNTKGEDGKVTGIPEGLDNLENLSMINCGLTTLEVCWVA